MNRNRELSGHKTLTMYHLKQQIGGLRSNLIIYDGAQTMRLSSLFSTLRDTIDTLGSSKVAAVRVLDYFLGVEDKDLHAEQLAMVQ